MRNKSVKEAQNPLILRCHRLIDAFAKADDERDFYLDRKEGFIIYVDLDKPEDEIELLENELRKNSERYFLLPKLTFYETKKIMESFVNEKVYDIDTKEKLLEIIQSKEARENFLEFIYDHHSELEKWQQFYQERSRIRIIEWLRNNQFNFVFEEDLDLPKSLLEKVKHQLFEPKVGKDVWQARKVLHAKAKTYYSNEALNPRPKRGRPPKQTIKLEIEPQVATDIYTMVPAPIRPFLFIPDLNASAVAFSSKFETEEQLLAGRRGAQNESGDQGLQSLNQKLAALRNLSSKWLDQEKHELKKIPSRETSMVKEIDQGHLEEEEEISVEKVSASKTKQKSMMKLETVSKKIPKKVIPKVKVAKAAMRKAKPIRNPKKKVLKPSKVLTKRSKIKLIDSKNAIRKPKQKIKLNKKTAKFSVKQSKGKKSKPRSSKK